MAAESREAELNRLLGEALELPPEQWRPFLEEAASDPELAREVEALLQGEAGLGSFLKGPDLPASEAPTIESATVPSSRQASSEPGREAPGSLRDLTLADRYRLIDLLGKGGMGEVYRAEDLKLGEEIALKLLPRAKLNQWQQRQLYSEVRIARQITHANVCRVHDIGEAEGLHFLTMELIRGENLAELLKARGMPEIEHATRIGVEVCEGLSAVHQKGILHRDVKPANLMIDEAGRVRLTDFGVAGLAGEAAIGGTPAYMAPELISGREASVQSELFALGVVLYELFTTRRPFRARALARLSRGHQQDSPVPLSEHRAGVPPVIEETILRCLAVDPGARPTSAAVVASAFRGGSVPAEVGTEIRLREATPPPFPDQPYPVLLPYQHPDLFAGRDREIEDLRARLGLPVPILALCAPSGVGKSSLLTGGLYPSLRAAGHPAVLERYPAEPGLLGRLLDGLLQAEGGISMGDSEIEGFVSRLIRVEDLADGAPPILILDQVEDLFRLAGASRTRAVLGLLLAATCRRPPGRAAPPCRWVLAYREEYHGALTAWLTDVCADAEREGLGEGLAALPRDLSKPDRLQVVPLEPLATPIGSTLDLRADAARVFLSAIRAPLVLERDGKPRYPWRFAEGADQRLADAMAEARLDQLDAPLAPKLQVVLAYLLEQASPPDEQGIRWIDVPDDIGRLIDRALDDHLRRVLEAAFPQARGVAQGRARAVLALRQLASVARDRGGSLPAARLEQAIGDDGRRILEILAGPAARLVVPSVGGDGQAYRLSHDRIAEAVDRLVDEEGRRGGLVIDSELLALRRRIGLQSALYHSGEKDATALSGASFRQIARHADALLWDDERRSWWQACRRQRRLDHLRRASIAVLALLAIGLGSLAIRTVVSHRAERQANLERLATGDPESAFRTLDSALDDFQPDDLLAALRRRPEPLDLLAKGLGGIDGQRRARALVRVAELLLPLIEEDPEERHQRLASLLWALDYSAVEEDAAESFRQRALAPRWVSHPPPSETEEAWVAIPGGSFWMGAGPEEGRTGDDHLDELPRHRVTVSAFELFAHEVTNAEYRRLFPDHPGADDLPATGMSWYDAVVYAAWLGGRLPTEAEWEYAARSGCDHRYCTTGGTPVAIDRVAWWIGNSAGEDGESSLQPVARLLPNQHGLFDIYGNVWEWTADWYGLYSQHDRVDPRGPTVGSPPNRLSRGGSVFNPAEWTHPSGRHSQPPEQGRGQTGFRPARDTSQ